MSDYKNILLTTDFSTHSEAAGHRAMDVAQRYNATLTLFHVVEVDAPQVMPGEWSQMINNGELESYWVSAARNKLTDFAERIGASDAEQVVITGLFSPKRDILNYAKEKNMDLIVMGTHGKFGIDILLGSTASGVVHKSQCDVLTVRL